MNIGFIYKILLNVIIIFFFLTFFFFLYVVNVEKSEFQTQINLIVDNIFANYSRDIASFLPPKQDENLQIGVIGTLAGLKYYSSKNLKSSDSDVEDKNKVIKYGAYKLILLILSILIGITIIIYVLGFDTNFKKEFKYSLIVLIFVALTELIFLQIIAKNYIAANPSEVKIAIGTAIDNYIKRLDQKNEF